MILSKEYYQNPDVLFLARDLIGKYLFTKLDEGIITGGMIVETEGYRGIEDKASHAYGGRLTKRTQVLYQEGGVCYVYLCYGIHYLLNVVTNSANIPHAVLIRSIKPEFGVELMKKRRIKNKSDKSLTLGPGSSAQALGINLSLNGASLQGPKIWIEDRGVLFHKHEIHQGPRIGVDYAGKDALLPWRFYI